MTSTPLNPLDHAGRQRGQQQLGRIESLGLTCQVGGERNLGLLAQRCAALGINAP